jgi:hypothetical protein
MSHSEARMSYAYLTGWWGALYLGYVFNIKPLSSVIAFLVYFFLGTLAVFLDWSWFYMGLPDIISIQYLIALVVGGVAFVSPIFFNAAVRFIESKIKGVGLD